MKVAGNPKLSRVPERNPMKRKNPPARESETKKPESGKSEGATKE